MDDRPGPGRRTIVLRRVRGVVLLVAFFGLLVGWNATHAKPAPKAQLDFTATTVDGAAFAGRGLAGRPVALWFWTPWCPACASEAPAVAAAAREHPEVSFVGVAALGEVPAMREFVARHQLQGFTHLADKDGAVWQRFGVTNQPAYAFVGSDGSVQVERQVSERELAKTLDLLTTN